MMARVDEQGAAFAGSQLQTQLWVNRRPQELSDTVRERFPELKDAELKWVSPLEDDKYREYQDSDFLERVGLGRHADELTAFWPPRGPVWDALAVIDGGGGVILAEGKSYPGEIHGSGAQAGERSLQKIEAALARTQKWLGLDPEPSRWTGRLYQTANRLAHLYWLNEVVNTRAWLVHLLFVNDPRTPTSRQEWAEALKQADRELGLRGPAPRAGHVFLEAGNRAELVG